MGSDDQIAAVLFSAGQPMFTDADAADVENDRGLSQDAGGCRSCRRCMETTSIVGDE
jgi:hypothetical protein